MPGISELESQNSDSGGSGVESQTQQGQIQCGLHETMPQKKKYE